MLLRREGSRTRVEIAFARSSASPGQNFKVPGPAEMISADPPKPVVYRFAASHRFDQSAAERFRPSAGVNHYVHRAKRRGCVRKEYRETHTIADAELLCLIP